MTEDILFDNIYIGHSIEDAQALAAETFDVKKPLEVAADKAAQPAEDVDEEVEDLTFDAFKADPVTFLRGRLIKFVDAAKVDPVAAFKAQPQTAATLGLAMITFFGMLGTLFGLVGGQQKPITKVCRRPVKSIVGFFTNLISSSPQRRLMPPPPMTKSRRKPPLSPPQVKRRRRLARRLIPRLRSASKMGYM